MKNVSHPNMFPGVAAADAPESASAEQAPVVTDADVGGIAAPSTAWANPSKLTGFKPAEQDQAGKKLKWPERVIAYLLEHGPSTGSVIMTALHMGKRGQGIHPFISKAINDGLIVKHGRSIYALPGQEVPETPEPTSKASPAPQAEKPKAVPPSGEKSKDAPRVDIEGRKPDFVIFVAGLQLLAWPSGGVSIQHEDLTVELDPAQTRALLVLAELQT
ncbi:hypothetical protein Q8F57_003405 [Paraburkholderia terrae]|uniref:hypothetical protein n=1 Tax=Paraburkholderia terrae TaxID=311230 RepID=UPI00296B4747|nr:hypothetical protein [Paraburkholderia terrae]MDW3655427.1 hypothetical protein [Paraburkholderia terrae]